MISSVRFPSSSQHKPPSRPFCHQTLPRIAGTVSRAYILSERKHLATLGKEWKGLVGHQAALCVGETLNCSSPTDWYEHRTALPLSRRSAALLVANTSLAFTSNRETSPATIYCPPQPYLRPLPKSSTLPTTLNKRTFDLTLPLRSSRLPLAPDSCPRFDFAAK